MSWPSIKLSEVCSILSGFAFQSGAFGEIGLPLIRIRDVVRGYTETKYHGEYEEKYIIENDDILIGMDGDFNLAKWKGGKALLNQRVCKLIPDITKIDSDYLYYFLPKKLLAIWKATPYVTVKHLSVKQINEILIHLPPLPVQKQIAKILEQADTLRQQCQQMEQELNALAQSVFLDMFGDYRNQDGQTFCKLGEIADVCSGVIKGQNLAGKTTIVAPYMRVANVQDGYLDLSVIKEIEVKISDFEKYKLKSGDVLLTEGGDFDKLGRGAVWADEIPNCIHQNHIFRVRFEQNINPKYFEFYLQSGVAREYFLRCAKKTTNLASINITQLKSLPVPIESKEKQDNFEHFISRIDKQINITRSDLAEKNILFNAIIQKAFNGQLNIQAVA